MSAKSKRICKRNLKKVSSKVARKGTSQHKEKGCDYKKLFDYKWKVS